MKKALSIILVLCLLLTMAACGKKEEPAPAPASSSSSGTPAASSGSSSSTPAAAPAVDPLEAADPLTLTLATAGSDGEMSEEGCKKFAQLCNEYSNGKLTIDYVNGAQLGSATELAEGEALGSIQMAKLDPSTMNDYAPEYALLVQPFLIQNYDHMAKVVELDSVKALADGLAKDHNIKLLNWFWCGFRAICSKTPIRNVADCKGIILRSPEAKIYMDTFNLLGMAPTPLAFGEMYTALQAGVIEGCEPAASVIYQYEFYKLAPYVCRSNHMFSMVILTISNDIWNSLPEVYQDIMLKASEEARAWEWAAMEADEDSYFENMAADGATITTWDNFQELVDLFTPYWQESIDRIGGSSEKIVNDIKGAL